MAAKRELIEPHQGDKRFVRRDATGKFGEQTDVGRSLAADRRQKAKATVTSGQGDKGDRSARKGPKQADARSAARSRSR